MQLLQVFWHSSLAVTIRNLMSSTRIADFSSGWKLAEGT